MLDRRHLAIATLTALAATGLSPAIAATKDEAAVADAIEAFRKAMLGSDRKAFAALCADALSYGHSSGKLQDKTVFIEQATNGSSTWTAIALSDKTIRIAGANAIARFTFTGQSVSQGKTNDVKIGILMVWTKQGGHWRLLARQGYKV